MVDVTVCVTQSCSLLGCLHFSHPHLLQIDVCGVCKHYDLCAKRFCVPFGHMPFVHLSLCWLVLHKGKGCLAVVVLINGCHEVLMPVVIKLNYGMFAIHTS
jgi:hypothetical protein